MTDMDTNMTNMTNMDANMDHTDTMCHITLLYRIFWRKRRTIDPNYWSSLSNGYEQIQQHLNAISIVKLVSDPLLER